MRRSLTTLAAVAVVAGTTTIASAATIYAQSGPQPDAYGYRGYTYDYYNDNNFDQSSPYDQRFYGSTRPTITNPGGEGGGVQNPHLGPGINGSDPTR
jgi:hypothetical protein